MTLLYVSIIIVYCFSVCSIGHHDFLQQAAIMHSKIAGNMNASNMLICHLLILSPPALGPYPSHLPQVHFKITDDSVHVPAEEVDERHDESYSQQAHAGPRETESQVVHTFKQPTQSTQLSVKVICA